MKIEVTASELATICDALDELAERKRSVAKEHGPETHKTTFLSMADRFPEGIEPMVADEVDALGERLWEVIIKEAS